MADKNIYEWSGAESDCPDDLVVNAGAQTLIIGAAADNGGSGARLDPGDRRQGAFFGQMVNKMPGLMRLKDVPAARRLELEKIRQIRSGDREPEWVEEARRRAAANHQPSAIPVSAYDEDGGVNLRRAVEDM